MKNLLIILLLFSCSEVEVSPCYKIKQDSIEARERMEVARGTDRYESLKQQYFILRDQASECYSQ